MLLLLHRAYKPWSSTCCVDGSGGRVRGGMTLLLDVLAGCWRGDPTDERRETGLGASRCAFGGLRARAGRSAGCQPGLAAPGKPEEPMRSSSARKFSDASMLAPKPSIERVLRWLLPAPPHCVNVSAADHACIVNTA